MQSEPLVALRICVVIIGSSLASCSCLIRVSKTSASPPIHVHSIHAEKGLEDFVEFIKLLITGVPMRVVLRPVADLLIFGSEPIVPFLLFGVYEDAVCVGDFFEDFLGAWVRGEVPS